MNSIEALVTTDDPALAHECGLSGFKHPHLILRKWAREGKIPAIKRGRAFYFSIPTIRRWYQAQFENQIAQMRQAGQK